MAPQVRPRNPDSRLMETGTPDAVTVHWMPKDEKEWECPQCGAWFLWVEGKGWTKPWVA